MRLPIFTDDPGWHGEQLKQAFAKRDVDAVYVPLNACSLDIAGNPSVVRIPTFDQLPRGAFVRGVSGGTLQQVITRLNILHMLQQSGVTIYNQPKAIERTVDKAMTSFLLYKNDVATPATWVCESRQHAEIIYKLAIENQQQLVLKPLFGSQGIGVRKLATGQSLPVPMEQYIEGVYYLQQYIETANEPHDFRVFVINGRVAAAMKRSGPNWINNVAAGGVCEAFEADAAMKVLAVKAAAAVDIDYCGVDIIQSISGEYYVLEVNSIPAWKGLQSVTDVNIADLLVEDFLHQVSQSNG